MRRIPGDQHSQLSGYKKAVEQHPDSSKAHFRLGTALINVGFLGEGQESLQRAVELDPGNVKAWINLGGAYLARWNFAGCIEANQKALECDPELTQAYFNMGLARMYAGEPEPMVTCFEKVVELEPGNAAGFYHLAVGYEALGDRDKARALYEKSVGMGYSPDPSFVKAMEQETASSQSPASVFEIGPEPGDAVTLAAEDVSKQESDLKRREPRKE